MIINHAKNLIFFANMKTASTSIGIAFSSSCSNSDVITPLGRDESIRRKLGYQSPCNYIPLRNKHLYLLIEARSKLFKKSANASLKKIGLHTHITPTEALSKQYIKAKIFDEYFKFCFIRNPWSHTISQYYWATRPGKDLNLSLDSFINNGRLENFAANSRAIYTLEGKPCMNRICKYENAQEELSKIFNEFDLKGCPALPRSKTKLRLNKQPYQEILTDQQARKISEIFAPEIELGKYTY